jgi:hypothetical protein
MPLAVGKQMGTAGWRIAAIPLRAFQGFGKTNHVVQQIQFSMNSRAIVYLSDMDIVTDPLPIVADVEPHYATVKAGDRILLRAEGDAGLTALRFVWDFDARDGLQEDADSQNVGHTFKRTGSYTVTVTVEDRYGLKKPLQKRIAIKVVR